MINVVCRSGWLAVVASLFVSHGIRAEGRDAAVSAPSSDVRTGAPSHEPTAATAVPQARVLIERQAEARCVTELNGLHYYEARTSPEDRQRAAAFREVADSCMKRARSALSGMPKAEPISPAAARTQRDELQADYDLMKSSPERVANGKQDETPIERRTVPQESHDEAVALYHARRADPRWMRPLLSAQVCRATRERAVTSSEIAKEKKLAHEAGVVDLEMMREYQNTLRDDDQEIASARAGIRALKLKVMSCSDPTVKAVADCLDVYTPRFPEEQLQDVCKDPNVLSFVRLTKDERDL